MTRVLLLTFYYPPDLSAGSFRASALADALLRVGGPDVTLDVITSTPNRYGSFNQHASAVELQGNLSIYRVQVPLHHSGMLGQARSFYRFARSARLLAHGRSYDIVVATSSRLFTAWLGRRIAVQHKSKLVLDIRDIFVESIRDVLGPYKSVWLVPVLRVLERTTFASADEIVIVSPGFVDYVHERYAGVPHTVCTNGVDDEFASFPAVQRDGEATSEKLILYAGNVGAGQALDEILPDAAAALAGKVRFLVVGDGGRRVRLERELRARRLENVDIRNPVKREELKELYMRADALLLHVGELPAFARVLPSKIFEYAATGKPIIAGVGVTAARFLRDNVSSTYFFKQGQSRSLTEAVNTMDWSIADRSAFVKKFLRRDLMKKLALQILARQRRVT